MSRSRRSINLIYVLLLCVTIWPRANSFDFGFDFDDSSDAKMPIFANPEEPKAETKPDLPAEKKLSEEPTEKKSEEKPAQKDKPSPEPIDFGFDFGLPATPQGEVTSDFDFGDFDFGFDETISDVPPAEIDLALTFHLPLFGELKLIPVTDEKTGKEGFQAKAANEDKKITIGPLTIDDATLHLFDEEVYLSGRATLFGKQGKILLKDVQWGNRKTIVQSARFDFEFDDKPQVPFIQGKKLTLEKIQLITERGKPLIIEGFTDIFKDNLRVGFTITKKATNMFVKLEKDTPLISILPSLQNSPLRSANVVEGKLVVHNLMKKELKNTKPISVDDVIDKINDENKDIEKIEREDRHATLDATIDLGTNSPLIASVQDLQKMGLPANASTQQFKLSALFAADNVQGTISAPTFALKNIGVINDAQFIFDTTSSDKDGEKKAPTIQLLGKMTFDIKGIGPLTIDVKSDVTANGIAFAGTVPKKLEYAGLTLEELGAQYDSIKNVMSLVGKVNIQGLPLTANLSLVKDKENPKKYDIQFKATSKTARFAPFEKTTIKPLQPLVITDLDTGIDVAKKDGKITHSFNFSGNLDLFGTTVPATARFINTKEGKGIYIEVPFAENKTIAELIPMLNFEPFKNIQTKEAYIFASNVDFVHPETKKKINKGFSFLAKVPLAGPLAQAGKLVGAQDKDFTLTGTFTPGKPTDSKFGIVLAEGTPDPNKQITLDEIVIGITGTPSIGTSASIIFRPKPEEEYLFSGDFKFKDKKADLAAGMQGTWKNPLGFKGWELSDINLIVGMVYGSPGLPTELGGTATLNIEDRLLLDLVFLVDVDTQQLGFEGKAETDDKLSFIEIINFATKHLGFTIPGSKAPILDLYNLFVKFATRTMQVNKRVIEPGIVIQGKMDVLGKTAEIDVRAVCGLDFCGLKGYGAIEPINIKNILKVTGTKEDPKPNIDIEYSTERQLFHIAGLLSIANVLKSETYLDISNKGITFDFDQSLGGTWEGKPVLGVNVSGQSSGSLKNPDFTIHIAFSNHFQQYVKHLIQKGLETAKQEVEKNLNAAIKEIDKIDSAIKKSDEDIKKAEEQVAKARRSLDSINSAIDKANRDLNSAQAKVDRIKEEIKKRKYELEHLPKSKAYRAPDISAQIAANVIALETATLALKAAKAIATGTLVASRETAKFTLRAAEELLDKVIKNVSRGVLKGSAVTAQTALKGIKEGTVFTLKGANWVLDQGLLTSFGITEMSYDGNLEDMKDAKLGNVRVEFVVLDEVVEGTMTIDLKNPIESTKNALKPLVESIAKVLFKKASSPVNAIKNAIKPAKQAEQIQINEILDISKDIEKLTQSEQRVLAAEQAYQNALTTKNQETIEQTRIAYEAALTTQVREADELRVSHEQHLRELKQKEYDTILQSDLSLEEKIESAQDMIAQEQATVTKARLEKRTAQKQLNELYEIPITEENRIETREMIAQAEKEYKEATAAEKRAIANLTQAQLIRQQVSEQPVDASVAETRSADDLEKELQTVNTKVKKLKENMETIEKQAPSAQMYEQYKQAHKELQRAEYERQELEKKQYIINQGQQIDPQQLAEAQERLNKANIRLKQAQILFTQEEENKRLREKSLERLQTADPQEYQKLLAPYNQAKAALDAAMAELKLAQDKLRTVQLKEKTIQVPLSVLTPPTGPLPSYSELVRQYEKTTQPTEEQRKEQYTAAQQQEITETEIKLTEARAQRDNLQNQLNKIAEKQAQHKTLREQQQALLQERDALTRAVRDRSDNEAYLKNVTRLQDVQKELSNIENQIKTVNGEILTLSRMNLPSQIQAISSKINQYQQALQRLEQ